MFQQDLTQGQIFCLFWWKSVSNFLRNMFCKIGNVLGITRCRSEGSLRGSSGGMRHHSSRESWGNASQNSSQSLNELDKVDNNGSVQTAFFVPDGDFHSGTQKSPVPKRYDFWGISFRLVMLKINSCAQGQNSNGTTAFGRRRALRCWMQTCAYWERFR